MFAIEINLILTNLFRHCSSYPPIRFLGVYSRDQIPSESYVNTLTPCSYVANIDPSNMPGSHWVAFYHPAPNYVYFFDSFGSAPSLFDFKFPGKYHGTHNHYLIQSLNSQACGQYCIYFLYLCATHQDVNHLLHRFSLLPSQQADALITQAILKIKRLFHIK